MEVKLQAYFLRNGQCLAHPSNSGCTRIVGRAQRDAQVRDAQGAAEGISSYT